jgi:hypothetical protein
MALLITGITVALASVGATVKPSRAADDCLAKPNAASPQGSHWYYRVDRAMRRNCWYLRPEGKDGSAARSHPSTVSARPASQTATEPRTADPAGAGPLAAEPLPVKVAAELVPAEVPGQADDAEFHHSEIEE